MTIEYQKSDDIMLDYEKICDKAEIQESLEIQ